MEKVYSVSEFNKMIKNYIDDIEDFQEFFLEGEISNITYYKSGHLYFSIKDKKAQIKCVAFNYRMKKIPEDLKEGDFIKLFGDVSFYEVRGDFQVLARYLEKTEGLGNLFAKLEKIKEEMSKEGYFDEKHKKSLPKFPKNIGVVTALTGAALHDIIMTTRKRFNSINIYVCPAKVQGKGSVEEIIKGIEILNKIDEIDMIIAGRGGGSIEDLWSFNEEAVAVAFYNSSKPIISAVGHEIDFLLSDFTADARAATPTQAIELSVPDKNKLKVDLNNSEKYLTSLLNRKISEKRKNLLLRKENYYLKNFQRTFNNYREVITEKEIKIKELMNYNFESNKILLNSKIDKLLVLNPINTLKRGYSISIKDENRISEVGSVNKGDEISTILSDGKIISIVKEKIYEKKDNN